VLTKKRSVVIVLGLDALLFVYARLIGHHYYRLTYAACEGGSSAELCGVWQRRALVEALIVLGSVIAVWLYLDSHRGKER
jgi:hypothetical protein